VPGSGAYGAVGKLARGEAELMVLAVAAGLALMLLIGYAFLAGVRGVVIGLLRKRRPLR
jgi:hypothetical protein